MVSQPRCDDAAQSSSLNRHPAHGHTDRRQLRRKLFSSFTSFREATVQEDLIKGDASLGLVSYLVRKRSSFVSDEELYCIAAQALCRSFCFGSPFQAFAVCVVIELNGPLHSLINGSRRRGTPFSLVVIFFFFWIGKNCCLTMSSTSCRPSMAAFTVSSLAKRMHDFPHRNRDFKEVSNVFAPTDTEYLEVSKTGGKREQLVLV